MNFSYMRKSESFNKRVTKIIKSIIKRFIANDVWPGKDLT